MFEQRLNASSLLVLALVVAPNEGLYPWFDKKYTRVTDFPVLTFLEIQVKLNVIQIHIDYVIIMK